MTNKEKCLEASRKLILMYKDDEKYYCPYCSLFRYNVAKCTLCPMAINQTHDKMGCTNTYGYGDSDYSFIPKKRIIFHAHLINEFEKLPNRAFTQKRTKEDIEKIKEIINWRPEK